MSQRLETFSSDPEEADPEPSRTDRAASVVIIGAGLGGLAVAYRLHQAHIDDFVVLEASPGLGGTWWSNRYPGAEVDVTSELYSYSFEPHVFSRTHARQGELLDYIQDVARKTGIDDKVRLGSRVTSAEWDGPSQEWTVTTDTGESWRAASVVAAVGQLSNPRYPDLPGLADFTGPIFHTARWEQRCDLTDKVVAIIGTGSTSAQIVPMLAPQVKHLYVYQRQPGWVLPKPDQDYGSSELRRLRRWPGYRRLRRFRAFVNIERMRPASRAGGPLNAEMEMKARQYLQETIADPDLRRALTPNYPFLGKRIVLTKDFYPALNQPAVTLVPHAVTTITTSGLVDATGVERPVDVIILATGFWPMRFLSTLTVIGAQGRTLDETWGDEPRAFLGLMVPGFPNFFMTYGPNTNGGDVLFTLERQAEWIVRAVCQLRKRPRGALEVRPRLLEWIDRRVVSRNDRAAWASASNYYKSATGRVVTQWPYSQTLYWALLRLLSPRVACTAPAGNVSTAVVDRAATA